MATRCERGPRGWLGPAPSPRREAGVRRPCDGPGKDTQAVRYSAALASQHTRDATVVPIDPQKTYELSQLIDVAQRNNPETRVAWERARQAALAAGLAEGAYYPLLALAATGAVAHVPTPIPQTVVLQYHVRCNAVHVKARLTTGPTSLNKY